MEGLGVRVARHARAERLIVRQVTRRAGDVLDRRAGVIGDHRVAARVTAGQVVGVHDGGHAALGLVVAAHAVARRLVHPRVAGRAVRAVALVVRGHGRDRTVVTPGAVGEGGGLSRGVVEALRVAVALGAGAQGRVVLRVTRDAGRRRDGRAGVVGDLAMASRRRRRRDRWSTRSAGCPCPGYPRGRRRSRPTDGSCRCDRWCSSYGPRDPAAPWRGCRCDTRRTWAGGLRRRRDEGCRRGSKSSRSRCGTPCTSCRSPTRPRCGVAPCENVVAYEFLSPCSR